MSKYLEYYNTHEKEYHRVYRTDVVQALLETKETLVCFKLHGQQKGLASLGWLRQYKEVNDYCNWYIDKYPEKFI